MVATPATAVRIAEAVAESLYGQAEIRQQRPYAVTDTPQQWIVRGTRPDRAIGGVFEIVINKRDGAILFVMHGK